MDICFSVNVTIFSTDKFISPFICLLTASQNFSLIIIIWLFNLQRAEDCLLAVLRICDKMLKFFSASSFGLGPECMREDMRLLFLFILLLYNALLFLLHLFHPVTLISLPERFCWGAGILGKTCRQILKVKITLMIQENSRGTTLSKEIRALFSLKCSSIWTSLSQEGLICPSYLLFPDSKWAPYVSQNIFPILLVTQYSSSFGMNRVRVLLKI